MAVLAHINIRTGKFEETISFYEELFGFRRSVSPVNPDTSKNMWLLDGEGNPWIHVNNLRPQEDQQSASSCLDHVAFNCEDMAGFKSRLRKMDVDFEERSTRIPQLIQINVKDPNGVVVELTFGHEHIVDALASISG